MKEKVIVYDWGWGGGIISKYIEDQLGIKAERIIDIDGMQLIDSNEHEICEYVEGVLMPYIGQAEVIVLANSAVTVAAEAHLKRRFPKQKFIGYGYDLDAVVQGAERAIILAPRRVQRTEQYQMMKAKCQETDIREPDVATWMEAAGRPKAGRPVIEEDMSGATGVKIVIYHPKMMVMEKQLEELVGWRGEVVDMRDEIVKNVRKALKIKY